jgi:large subunit ribosomal protein L25
MELELNAQVREKTGKKLKTFREKGFIPAVVYGPGHKPISVQVNYDEFRRIFEQAGESTLIKLKVGDQTPKNVLIHDFARDPISDETIHIDFYQVRMDKPITAEVPLVFEGEAPAVKNLEGVLVKNITEVEIEALPKDLLHEIKVDISSLDSFDKHVKIKDLELPVGVKVLLEPEEIIATVIPPRAEEIEEKPAEKVEVVEGAPTPAEGEVGVPTSDKDRSVGKEQSKTEKK